MKIELKLNGNWVEIEWKLNGNWMEIEWKLNGKRRRPTEGTYAFVRARCALNWSFVALWILDIFPFNFNSISIQFPFWYFFSNSLKMQLCSLRPIIFTFRELVKSNRRSNICKIYDTNYFDEYLSFWINFYSILQYIKYVSGGSFPH